MRVMGSSHRNQRCLLFPLATFSAYRDAPPLHLFFSPRRHTLPGHLVSAYNINVNDLKARRRGAEVADSKILANSGPGERTPADPRNVNPVWVSEYTAPK